MKFFYRILLIILFLFAQQIVAQKEYSLVKKERLHFESIDSKDGLIHNTINSIFQDSKGYMWFGAFNGLYKYNGYTFKLYRKNKENHSIFIENYITEIYEDGDETVWIGTKRGLYFYDRNNDSFSNTIQLEGDRNNFLVINDKILCIYQDSSQNLWISTSRGIYILNRIPSKKHIYRFKQINKNVFIGKIKAIVEDQGGNLWIGTNKGLKVVPSGNINNKWIDYTKFLNTNIRLTDLRITDLAIDYRKNIWIGTQNGLNKISLNTSSKSHQIDLYFYDDENVESLTGNYIKTICPDKDGTVWIGTNNSGISRYYYEDNSFVNFSNNNNKSKENSINSNQINSIYQSANNIIWIGYVGGAINKLDPYKNTFFHYKHLPKNSSSISDNMINSIYEDSSKNIWISTSNGGINLLKYSENKEVKFNVIEKLDKKNIYSSVVEDRFGNFWIGTLNNGLYHVILKKTDKSLKNIQVKHYNKEKGNLPSNNISTVYVDYLGDVWMGSFVGDGLMKFTPNRFDDSFPLVQQYRLDSINTDNVNANNIATIFEDSNKLLWVGTYGNGIAKIERDDYNNPLEHHFIKYSLNGFSNNNAFSFHEDLKGNIWIATFGGGLNKIVKDEKFKKKPKIVVYGEKEGLSNEELYGILEDNLGNLWISSNNGIYRFNPVTEVFTNFQVRDGLQELNFRRQAFVKGHDGFLYFGGINGFNVFNPNNFKENPFAPRVEIVDFKLFNKRVKVNEKILGKTILSKSIPETEEIILNYNHKTFSFKFSTLHYSSPNQNNYAYKLEGWDSDWIYTSSQNRFATYSNIDKGTYTFKVKASNNDNLWNNKAKEIRIEILPAPWETWWAYFIYGSIVLLFLWLFKKFILIRESLRNKLQIEKIKQQKIKDINKLKLEFFTNIAHEFKTPLTLILGPLQNIIKTFSNNIEIKEPLLVMERNAQYLYRLIDQVIEFRKIESKQIELNLSHINLVEFCKETVGQFKELAALKNINLSFKSNKTAFDINIDPNKVENILYNLISNAIKYTKEKGTVSVKLKIIDGSFKKINQRKFIIQVSDTGIGIPKDQLKLIFNRFYIIESSKSNYTTDSGIGLALIKALVEFLQGKISVKSKENSGSIFTVEIPYSFQPDAKNHTNNKPSFFNFIEDNKTTVKTEDIKLDGDNLNKTKENNNDLKTLLLVEDNRDMQAFIKKSLKFNYKVLQAYDGLEGYKLACQEMPDIIVSDIMMPNMDGVELCSLIKKSHITNHIPFVLLTAKSEIEHRIKGIEVGADAYIPKPFYLTHLKVQLQNLLTQRELLRMKFSNVKESFSSKQPEIKEIDKKFLENSEKIIEDNLLNPQFGIENFATELDLSQMQLYRKLKSINGRSPNEFVRDYRIKKAAELIRENNFNVTEVLYEVGYSSRSYFTKCFKDMFGVTPKNYINKHKFKKDIQ
ncbi:MAG: response regulator [Flavobacteriaceae bacterium]|nr:response regulator [Flavobacteriaceae bacterium]